MVLGKLGKFEISLVSLLSVLYTIVTSYKNEYNICIILHISIYVLHIYVYA